MTAETYQAPEQISGIQKTGIALALAGIVLGGIGTATAGLERFYEAYLVAYVFWTGVALGSLALLMVQHLTGGAWGVVIRRLLEASTRTLPMLAVMFVPIILGMGHLYHWTHPEAVAADPVLQAKAPYLNTTFFLVRQGIYFAVWIGLATLLSRWSTEQDRTGDPALAERMMRLSGGGLLAFGLTVTFAVVDWTMSVNPHWFSTMWGLLYIGGQGLSALAFAIAVLVVLAQYAPLDRVINPSHLHDLAKLLFAFLMLWAYLSFSQFIIIYSANTMEEVPHYLVRAQHGWQWVGWALVVLHFALPYALLLSRDVKRDQKRLRVIAIWILGMRLVDYYWHVAPEFHHEGLSVNLLDIGLPLAIGGFFISMFAAQLRGRSLLPVNDAGLAKALTHHTH